MIHHYKNIVPQIHESVFVAKNATIIGDVTIDEESSIWFQSVIRGDVAPTRIGKRSEHPGLVFSAPKPGCTGHH